MKKLKRFIVAATCIMLVACSQQTVNEQHEQYIENKGWEIKQPIEVETYTLQIPDEMLSNYEASGILFLRDHLGEEVTQYMYELKEKEMEGERLKAVIYEVDGETIGGYGVLPSWDPGVFNLNDKERLMEEQMIQL